MSIQSWHDFHSRTTKKPSLSPYSKHGSPKSAKMTSKWVPRGTQNRSKIDKNQDLGSKVSCWASPVPLDQQTGIKMMTQDPKNGAPRPPKCQDSRPHMHKAWPPHFFILQSIRPGLGFQNASQPIAQDRGAGGRGEALIYIYIYIYI